VPLLVKKTGVLTTLKTQGLLGNIHGYPGYCMQRFEHLRTFSCRTTL
jgi:hypothetical protein